MVMSVNVTSCVMKVLLIFLLTHNYYDEGLNELQREREMDEL